MRSRSLFVLVLVLLSPGLLRAENAPYRVEIDAGDSPNGILRTRLTLGVKAGPLTVQYPRWIPGKHGPAGPLGNVTALSFKAGDRTIAWKRDEVDFYSFHCTIPEGTERLEVTFDYLLSRSGDGLLAYEPNGNSPELLVVNWHALLLYPKEAGSMGKLWKASLRLPERWQAGSALAAVTDREGRLDYAPVALETLIDSPVLAGRNTRAVVLSPPDQPRHTLFLACDSPEGLELSKESEQRLRNLVAQSYALFGCRPYRSYTWLLALSDRVGASGLEHHESSDNRLPERTLLQDKGQLLFGYLLAHEMVHAWCGKFRRPAEMILPDYQQPQRTRLLWVYEGLTDYLAWVLTARAGFATPEEARELLAADAEAMRTTRGRTWRPLEDTALATSLRQQSPTGWGSWRRGADYYIEGILIWLDVDTVIREQSKGKAGLDDFCRKFLGNQDGRPAVKGFTLDEVVGDLNAIAPSNWTTFFERRVTIPTEDAPLEGVTRGGWKLTYGDKPAKVSLFATISKEVNLASSLGMKCNAEGRVTDVIRGTPADKAGLIPGMKLLAVNSRRFTIEGLTAALAATTKSGKIEFITENGDLFRQHEVAYGQGPRYPVLQRLEGRPDMLEAILKAR